MPTLIEILNKTTDYFQDKGIENSRLDAQLIIGDVLQLGRMDLYLNYDKPLSPAELDQCRKLVKRRSEREPLQHILGRVHFRNEEFKVDQRALIPRRETELIVDIVKDKGKLFNSADPVKLLEIGVGSGVILLSLMKECPEWKYTGMDISNEAVELAKENAKDLKLDVGDVINVGDKFSSFGTDEKWDIIVSNPPYVGRKELNNLMPEVKDWDPEQALFGGEEGFEFPIKLIQESFERVNPSGFLVMEIGSDQFPVLKEAAEKTGWKEISLQKDYSDLNRFISLQK